MIRKFKRCVGERINEFIINSNDSDTISSLFSILNIELLMKEGFHYYEEDNYKLLLMEACYLTCKLNRPVKKKAEKLGFFLLDSCTEEQKQWNIYYLLFNLLTTTLIEWD